MAIELNQLKEAARLGRINQSARREVFSNLRKGAGPLYELLDTAGWMAAYDGPREDELAILESFLDFKQDTMIPGLALTILCIRCSLDDRYADRIQQFLDVSHDVEGSFHLAGATAAGKLLKRRLYRDMVASLLRIVRDSEELPGTREAAYSALASARGTPLTDQIKERVHSPRLEDQDEILQWALQVMKGQTTDR